MIYRRKLLILIVHLVFRIRRFNNKCVRKSAKGITNKTILEIGSNGYSYKHFFDQSNYFIQSDIAGNFRKVDVTKMKYKNEFDMVVCMNVLEVVYEFEKAIDNVYSALNPTGIALFHIPCFYPLHDEPNDYWRFTEHSLRILFSQFREVKIKHSCIRRYPFSYYLEVKK